MDLWIDIFLDKKKNLFHGESQFTFRAHLNLKSPKKIYFYIENIC